MTRRRRSKGALATVKHKSFASITEPTKVGELLRAIRGYGGSDVVRLALQLLPLVFVRPGELRGAQWSEFAFDLADPPKGKKPQHPEPQWRIPAERMKMREQHIVPLINAGGRDRCASCTPLPARTAT